MNGLRQTEWSVEQADLLGAAGLIQRSRQFSTPVYASVIGSLAVVTVALGIAALVLTPAGTAAAIWWPAAGTGALLYLLYRGPRWQVLALVAGVGVLSNVVAGRPASFAVSGAAILVIEVIVFAWVLGPQGRTAMLGSVRGLVRFIAACIAAAATVGVTGGLFILLLTGADPFASFLALLPSHLSALLLIVPVALIPLPRLPDRQRLELVVQAALTVTVTVVIFAPLQSAAIGVLLFPLFGWAAMRFRPLVAPVELIVLGILASVLTVLGGGPYASVEGSLSDTLLVQIYLLSMALTIQFITVVRSERAVLRAENESRAAVLRSGFVGSQVGSVFVRPDPVEGVSIVEINDVAASLVDERWFEELLQAWLDSDSNDLSTEVTLDDGRTIQVHGQRVTTADGDTVLALQLVDITAFVSAQAAMAQAVEHERRVADRLRELSQQKDDFVSAVSHELRTPITSIVGFAEDLHDSATDEQREASTIILRNANRLTEMVEELLEIGRMTTPNPRRETESALDLSDIARDAVSDQSMTARDRQVSMSTDFSEQPAWVHGDTNALGRIATNLISNAIKFTPDGGTVTVSTIVDDDTVTLMVDDSGPGISEADQPRVFERFFRSADPERRQTPGTGLGLSIVKSLLELLDGQIALGRSPLGGARVTVTLPKVAETVESAAT
jgi:signal transduction histidine kinase